MREKRISRSPATLASLLAATLVAGSCTGGIEGPPVAPRSPLGVAGKPLIETPTGLVIADELIVRFDDRVSTTDATLAVTGVGGTVTYRSRTTGYQVARFADATTTAAAATQLAADERVLEVTYNHVLEGSGIGTSPTIELTRLQWNLAAMTLDPFASRPWAAGVTIAVLDTGVAYEAYADALGSYALAPDLEGVDFAAGYDFINDDAHPNDDQRHGTHITGIMVAERGIGSIAPGATILPVKVLDHANSGTELALAEGLRFAADSGADVVNMSLTFPPTYFPSRLLQSAVDHASQRGVILVSAAGNHGEKLVTYPAAFRDVIAIGASALPEDFAATGEQPWDDTLGILRVAPYSNHSYKLDVLAPAGMITSDADGDGNPEAVLAQTFALGDPTDFGYVFSAGTSQACAQASALIALMLVDNPELDAFQARAVLVENARALGVEVLSEDSGRGALRAHKTLAAARQAQPDRPRLLVDVAVTLHDVASGTIARAVVEVMDEYGKPAAGVTVYGLFTGAAFESVVGVTGADGVVTFDSAPLEGQLIVAFQVDALISGKRAALFDRPRGFVRIDSLSLEMLASFGSGIGTSPTGIGTSPTGSSGTGFEGAGIGTSPTIPLPLTPAQTPMTIAYDPALFAGTGYRPTLLLPNFSWGLATSPMAVAVDETWFLATFPEAAARRVVSFGRGLGTSPFLFTPSSFPAPISPPEIELRIPLILLTFTSGIGTSPTGIGTSPTGIGTSPTIWVDRFYSGIEDTLAREYESVLLGWWLSAAGIGTSPTYTGDYSFPPAVFDHLSSLANAYLLFAVLDVAAPSASYGDALTAAGMSATPVPPDADGEGVGVATLAP